MLKIGDPFILVLFREFNRTGVLEEALVLILCQSYIEGVYKLLLLVKFTL